MLSLYCTLNFAGKNGCSMCSASTRFLGSVYKISFSPFAFLFLLLNGPIQEKWRMALLQQAVRRSFVSAQLLCFRTVRAARWPGAAFLNSRFVCFPHAHRARARAVHGAEPPTLAAARATGNRRVLQGAKSLHVEMKADGRKKILITSIFHFYLGK
jgi:hypothetical protein